MNWRSLFSRRQTLHVIGDSHVVGFGKLENHLRKYKVSMCSVPGATASGLHNPHSKTLAGPIINKFIEEKVKEGDAVLVHLGEVDCGFLMWVRSEKNGISIEEQTELTLNNYFNLINKIARITTDIWIMSIIPQTIRDGSKIEDVANLRGQISANQRERTALSVLMNRRLFQYAEQNNFRFIDLDQDLIDKNTGVVYPGFLNENAQDHHLSQAKLIPMVAAKIESIR